MTEKKKMSLTVKMLIALVLGVITGLILQYLVPAGFIRDDIILDGILRFVGQTFLRGIWFIVVPLVLVSLVVGITTVTDPKKVGRIGGKLSLFYFFSTFPAIGFAMIFGFIINPGAIAQGTVEARFWEDDEIPIAAAPDLITVLMNIVPNNLFNALVTGQMLQVIFIAVVVGIAIIAIGKPAQPLQTIFVSANTVMMKITAGVMKVAPFGVFALIAFAFANFGYEAILSLIAFVGTVWLALLFHMLIIYGIVALKGIVGKDPSTGKSIRVRTLFRKAAPALAFAFSSASSAATLPITMKCGRNMGFTKEMASMTFPMGVTLNMDGTAIFQGVAIVFLSGFLGLELTVGTVVIVLISATLATLGTAGVPGAGMIMLTMVLANIGFPIGAIAIIWGIDRIVDMPRTAINVFGDFIYGMIVGKQEGMIDWEQFNSPHDAVLTAEETAAEAESAGTAEANKEEVERTI